MLKQNTWPQRRSRAPICTSLPVCCMPCMAGYPHWLQQLAASPRALLASPVLGKGGPRAEPTAGGWRWQCREPPRAEVGPERFGQFLCRVYFGFCCCSADKQMASQSITALGYYFVSMQMILLCCTVWLFTANC